MFQVREERQSITSPDKAITTVLLVQCYSISILPPVLTVGNKLNVRFYTDGFLSGYGFNMTFEEMESKFSLALLDFLSTSGPIKCPSSSCSETLLSLNLLRDHWAFLVFEILVCYSTEVLIVTVWKWFLVSQVAWLCAPKESKDEDYSTVQTTLYS